MCERQFTGRRALFPTVSSSLLRSLAQVRNSSYLWKGMTGSGSSLRYSLSREATVCTSVLLWRTNGGEQDGRLRSLFIVATRHRGKHKSSQILRATGVTGGQRREDNSK